MHYTVRTRLWSFTVPASTHSEEHKVITLRVHTVSTHSEEHRRTRERVGSTAGTNSENTQRVHEYSEYSDTATHTEYSAPARVRSESTQRLLTVPARFHVQRVHGYSRVQRVDTATRSEYSAPARVRGERIPPAGARRCTKDEDRRSGGDVQPSVYDPCRLLTVRGCGALGWWVHNRGEVLRVNDKHNTKLVLSMKRNESKHETTRDNTKQHETIQVNTNLGTNSPFMG